MLALVLGVIAVVSLPVVGPVAWWLGLADKRAVDAGRRDPSGRGAAVAGYVLGIVATVMLAAGVLLMLLALVAAVVALAFGVPAVALYETRDSAAGPVLERLERPGLAGLDDDELRARWLAAEPRGPGSGGSDADTLDRCALLPWLEGQFRDGMSTTEVTEAVGAPDSVRGRSDAEEVWLWNLGVCAFVDYDTYELVFDEGELSDWRLVRG